jgi:hypothetical protein
VAKAKDVTPLFDPKAKEKLQRAADSIGLSLQQLIDLVADSGAMTVPPAQDKDGFTPSLTMRDLGKRMWTELQGTLRPQRSEWFATLLRQQQVALVVTLREQGYRSEVVGQELGLPPLEVARIYNEHADNIGAQVANIRLNTLAGHVQLAAERAQEGLMKQEEWKAYFAVTKDLVAILQSLGIVDSAVRRVEVTHNVNFGEQQKAEVDAMVQLELKKQKRIEELKVADFSLIDEVPALRLEGEGETP